VQQQQLTLAALIFQFQHVSLIALTVFSMSRGTAMRLKQVTMAVVTLATHFIHRAKDHADEMPALHHRILAGRTGGPAGRYGCC
jgi:ABC-type nickel/cobalt efflux system permease component RcnA